MNSARARIMTVAIATVGLWALVAPPAHAYLDPGSGSLIIQAVAAGAMAVALTARLAWRRIKGFFARLTGREVHTEATSEPAEQ